MAFDMIDNFVVVVVAVVELAEEFAGVAIVLFANLHFVTVLKIDMSLDMMM